MSSNETNTEEANVQYRKDFLKLVRPLLVELVGTTIFVLIGISGACSKGGVLTAALCFGFGLMVLAASFSHISGVHVNPSVSLGLFIVGEITPDRLCFYMCSQLLGGVAAAGISRLLLPMDIYQSCQGGMTLLGDFRPGNISLTTLNADFVVHPWQGIFIELITTFVFVTVILMVAVDTKSKSEYAPMIIGFTLTALILATGPFTGGSLNPARSFGPALIYNRWNDHFVYWIGPLFGSLVAACFYRLIWAHDDRRLFSKKVAQTSDKA